jgi:hypothetical protein
MKGKVSRGGLQSGRPREGRKSFTENPSGEYCAAENKNPTRLPFRKFGKFGNSVRVPL